MATLNFPRDAEAGAAARVKKFHEKPELAKAKRYFAAGNYLLEFRHVLLALRCAAR